MRAQDAQKQDATQQAEWIKEGALRAEELLEATIAAIEEKEPGLNAIAAKAYDQARARATAPQQGPFQGVPFLLKDLCPYPGIRCAMGSRLFAQYVPEEATPMSQRLDQAGLLVVGKTTTSELGLLGSTETLLEGVTHNPWSTTHSAGGSSGGAAAAVAAGMVPFAHASDGGGSIRIPASLCGLFGFKPGIGQTLPSGPVHPLFANLLIEHCVSRSVRDSERFYHWMRTEAPEESELAKPLTRSLRIGVYSQTLVGEEPAPEVARALVQSEKLCRDLGHQVERIQPPTLDGKAISDAFFVLAGAGNQSIVEMVRPLLGRDPDERELEPFTLGLLDWFRKLPDDTIPTQLGVIEAAKQSYCESLHQWDVLLCPTIPILPPELGYLAPQNDWQELITRTETLAGYTPIHNMAGVPSMSVPLWRSSKGLPIGMHFAAAQGQESLLFALAYQLEQAQEWSQPLSAG